MPKLLNINTYHYRRGGSDAVYLEHATLFKNAGWDIAYFAMQHPDNDPSEWSRFFTPEIELGNDYSTLQKLKFAKDIIYSADHVARINALLDEFPADVAHLHLISHHISPAILTALKKRGTRIVMTAHDLKLLCPAYRMHDGKNICEDCKPNAVYNCAIKRCIHGSLPLSTLIAVESATHRLTGVFRNNIDRIVCPSKFYLEKYVEWGWPREKLTYTPNDFDVPKNDAIAPPGDYLCFFGRLSFEKGVATVVKACAKAGMPLHLIGEGPKEESLRKLASECGAEVFFHGRQTGEALFSIVRGARAVVLASEWYENAPKSVLEAFGLGKAVIGADIGGISEMVEEGRSGWLFPSGNVDALAARLSTLRETSDDELMAMGSFAQKFVEANFSTAQYLAAMKSLYRELGVEDVGATV